jgi:hypothetical protein
LKSGSLILLEPSGPVQACNGIALPLPFTLYKEKNNKKKNIVANVKVDFWCFIVFKINNTPTAEKNSKYSFLLGNKTVTSNAAFSIKKTDNTVARLEAFTLKYSRRLTQETGVSESSVISAIKLLLFKAGEFTAA